VRMRCFGSGLTDKARAICAALLVVLAVSFAGAGAVFAQTPVTVLGDEEDGFGRLVFAWPRHDDPMRLQTAPEVTTVMSANVLVLRFEEAFKADLSELMSSMPRYIALVREDADGKTLRLAMKAQFRVNIHEAGNEVYVDLLPPNWRAAPPPLPDAVMARLEAERKAVAEAKAEKEGNGPLDIPEPKPDLALRVGEHGDFTRLVFDWAQPVLYNVAQREGTVTLTFDRDAALKLARLRVDPPEFMTGATSVRKDGRLTVFVETEPGVTIRDFREDMSVVLDLVGPGKQDWLPVAAAPEPPESIEAEESAEAEEEEVAEAAPSPAGQAEETTEIASAEDAPVTDEPAKTQEEPAAEEKAAEAVPASTPEKEEKAAAPAAPPAPVAAKAASETKSDVEAQEPVESAFGEAVGADAARNEDDGETLTVAAEQVGSSVRLAFPWAERVGAAAFQRGGRVWIVFDDTRRIEFANLTDAMQRRTGEPSVFHTEGATILQFKPPQRLLVSASERGSNWIFSLGDTIVEPVRPVSLSRGWGQNGQARVSLDLNGAAKVHWLRDPEVKDVVAVVTAPGPAQGFVSPRNFVEFSALPTAQGLAFLSLSDDLSIQTLKDEVVVTRGSGLTLSSNTAADLSAAPEEMAEAPVQPGKMDFKAWRESAPGADYTQKRQHYLKRLTEAPTDNVQDRLDYARFLLAYELGAEAVAMLRLAEEMSDDVKLQPAFHALRGVGLFMMHRFDEALSDLSADGLGGDPHAALWRGAAQAELGNMREARDEFGRSGSAISDYEPDFQAMFRVHAAQAELAGGDLAAARFNLDEIPDAAKHELWLAQAQYVQALVLDAAGKKDEALEIFERLERYAPLPVQARARFAGSALKHRMGLMSDGQYMKELDAMRFMWRGDKFEVSVMERLGDMLVGAGDVEQGLKLMQSAVTHYPDTPEGRRIATKMTDTFAALFLDGEASDLAPIEALALFYDFRELTPIGNRGDRMIRQLSDRLVDVDLLDQAAELLEHQVDHRLRGIARSQVATRLALVNLMDRKPEKALEALRSSRQAGLPDNIAHKRLLLEARALSELGLHDHALDLLSEAEGEDVEWQRAEVYWDSQRWVEAGVHIERALAEKWKNESPLSERTRLMVMRAAIAYSLADDKQALDRIRAQYGEEMRDSPDGGRFAIVTEPIEQQGEEFRRLAKEFAEAHTLDDFVTTVGEGLDDGGIAIN